MEKQITYDKMFNVLNVIDIIMFEDEFSMNNSKNKICYGLSRMSVTNRNRMLAKMNEIDSVAKEQIEVFVNEFDKVFDAIDSWENEVPYNDIETALKIIQEKEQYADLLPVVREKYDMIDIDGWSNKDDLLSLLSSYGVGIEIPNLYEELFDEYICKKAHWECFRVFRDFSASTEAEFKDYLEYSLGNEGIIICILDDQLRKEKCATEIVRFLEKVQSGPEGRLNITGLIFSSFDNKDCISDKVYFEYIKKNASKKEFQAALTKSSYSHMLSELKGIYQEVLRKAFDEAVQNKNIAYYLSSMADCEGVTNYQVITNWIKLLFEYKLSDVQELTYVAGMTRLISLLEDEKLKFSKEMLDLNTFEAFDFSVNRYREPIASGDIFLIKKKLFILLGQDCDMMNSSTRTRKNGISELVTASTINKDNVDNAVKLKGQYMFISNFRKNKEDEVKTLRVRYSSREFMENQILQLCQFNDEGKCIIDINEKQYKFSGIEPEYYESLYVDLVSYFSALLQINKNEKSSLELVLKSSQSKRLISLTDYERNQAEKGIIDYKIHRICRLKHPYMLYLYKMYLEHQGRHPFDCMNMSRVQEVQVKLVQDDSISVSVDMILTPDREMNRMHVENMDWYIDVNVLENTISQMWSEDVEIQGDIQYIEIKNENTPFECTVNNGEKITMYIKKINDMVSIEKRE